MAIKQKGLLSGVDMIFLGKFEVINPRSLNHCQYMHAAVTRVALTHVLDIDDICTIHSQERCFEQNRVADHFPSYPTSLAYLLLVYDYHHTQICSMEISSSTPKTLAAGKHAPNRFTGLPCPFFVCYCDFAKWSATLHLEDHFLSLFRKELHYMRITNMHFNQ